MFKSQFTGYSINLLWNNLFLTQARDFCSHFGNFGSFGLHALSTKCSEAVQSWWPPIAGEPKKFPRENSGAKVQALETHALARLRRVPEEDCYLYPTQKCPYRTKLVKFFKLKVEMSQGGCKMP